VRSLFCDVDRVRGVTLNDGSEIRAPIVIAACDPRRTIVEWLASPPDGAAAMVRRWREAVHADGYGFQIELTYRAVKAGFTVAEVPILFRERRVGQSKMTPRIAVEAVWKVPALRLRRRGEA
jgi:hypothetical protein